MDYAIMRILHHCEVWHKDLLIWHRSILYANYQKDTYKCIFVHEPSGGAFWYDVPSCLIIENLNGTVLFSIPPSVVRSIKISTRINVVETLR